MSGRDVVVELGDDFASERVLARDVDTSVVFQEAAFARDSSFVGKGRLYPFVPKLLLSSSFFHLNVDFVRRGHDERPEMCGGKNGDIAVVVFPLVVVIAAGQ